MILRHHSELILSKAAPTCFSKKEENLLFSDSLSFLI